MRKLIYIITILIIVSCSGKEEVPKGVIAPEKMAEILSDIYLAEHKVNNVRIKQDSAQIVMRHYELKIFEDHNTTDSIYKESFKYYLDNPIKLESIYDIVIDSISLKEQVKNAQGLRQVPDLK
ncbi:DUF4296 domain-containing protein [Marivirga sp.]|uniref:DUF4296 domain-containing protein n=1 Tax=Marivirga sp. TaxID=2018662 RepID=UPI002D7E3C8C|nr:DUF4296 domain-containing protein [Marivirga sp.]HET8859140.1 DUF4296 domain-containing protein [Marivirga sp.]